MSPFCLGQFGDISSSFGMLWRFAPMADPLVTEWHSRDLDSVISEREAAAVADWRDNSLALYHVMPMSCLEKRNLFQLSNLGYERQPQPHDGDPGWPLWHAVGGEEPPKDEEGLCQNARGQ